MPPLSAILSPCVPVTGTVYGVAHYAEPVTSQGISGPASPVLFFKPKNTFLPSGGRVLLPESLPEIEATAVLGLVFGRDTRSVPASEAFDGVAGYTLGIDFTEPGAGILRPPIREKCRDGFLPIGPLIVPKRAGAQLENFHVQLEVDGKTVSSFDSGGQQERVARLIEQVSSFMAFRAGDVLLALHTPTHRYARVGSHLAATSLNIGRLECFLEKERGVTA